jgi:transglutaminase-like putative cysteine protease
MATLRKLRPVFLCALPFVAACISLAADSAPAPAQSWFDKHLETKIQLVQAQLHSNDTRCAIIGVALLDQISDFRDQVSNPTRIEQLFREIASDPQAQVAIREEAQDLQVVPGNSPRRPQSPLSPLWTKWTGSTVWTRVSAPSEARAKALLESAANADEHDLELLNAIGAIKLHHNRLSYESAEKAAQRSGSAEAWYRAARATQDEDKRIEAERTALEFDKNYIPAIADLSSQYSARGQLTVARVLLTEALQSSTEPLMVAELARLDINQGHGAAALEGMKALRGQSLSRAAAQMLSENYAQLGFAKEARVLASRGDLGSRGATSFEPKLHFSAQATNGSASSTETDDDATQNETEIATIPDSESEHLRRILHQGKDQPAARPERYFVDAAKVIENWRALSASKRSESRVLASVRIDQVRRDYQTIQHTQLLIALSSQTDVENYRTRAIQYSPQTQELDVMRARVYHANGSTSEAEDEGDTSVGDASVAAYYDLRTRQLRFRDLGVGDVVELEYTLTPASRENPYGNYFAELVAFGGALPCNLQRYIVRAPAELHLSSAQHLLGAPQIRKAANEITYVWERRGIPALVREPRSPSWSEQGAYVHVSNFQNWEALGEWYAQLVKPQFALSPELEKVVSELVARHPNKLDRVAEIDDLVLKNTRYVAQEFGVYGFKPYPVAQTYARRFGDCKDKASLMVALLRAAGIDAQIALVRTQRLGEIMPQPASAAVFDHAIVYVPEFDLWLDGTAEFAQLRELPVADQGAMALTVDLDGHAVLRHTPRSTADDNYSRRTINAQLDADGTIHFSGATYVRGEDAPEVRRQLEVREAKLGYVRDHLAQVLPAVEIHNVEAPIGSSEAVSLSFSGDLSVYRGHHSASLPSSWMERKYVAALAPSITRTQDLILEAPWTTEEEIHIQLPVGAKISSLPADQTLSTEFGNAELHYRVDGHEIVILSTVKFLQTRISASRFPAFRAFAADMEKSFHRNIEVELP